MRRRVFISAIGAFGASLLSGMAQSTKHYRVGILSADLPPPDLLEDFENELRKLGYVRGQNMVWELRNAEGAYNALCLSPTNWSPPLVRDASDAMKAEARHKQTLFGEPTRRRS